MTFKKIGIKWYSEFVSRNIGTISEDEQKKLLKSTVAIAGTGGVGGLLAERLTRIGIGSLKLSDPDSFENSNLNRQYGSNINTMGKKKVIIVTKELKKINPYLNVDYDSKGIMCQKDADIFIDGVDVVVDAMSMGLFETSIFLQRAARKKQLFFLFASAVAFGSNLIVFNPKGLTLEEYNGLPKDIDPHSLLERAFPVNRTCPYIPEYVYKKIDKTLIADMVNGKIPASINSIGVGLNVILTANEVINILLKKAPIIVAPRYIHLDLLERSYRVFRNNLKKVF